MPAFLKKFTRQHLLVPLLSLLILPSLALADEPGRGDTADFEVEYLQFIIDHHYSALRLTELAAGTDPERDAEITPDEGTSPTPSSDAVDAKATIDKLRSMARAGNRMQREEILTAQSFLRDWYGMDYSPQLTDDGREAIDSLAQLEAGEEFDQRFMEVFGRHHYRALNPTADCLVASDVQHNELHEFCASVLDSHLKEIHKIRELLSVHFNFNDYQPNVEDQDTGMDETDGINEEDTEETTDTADPTDDTQDDTEPVESE
jgi:uncharacterized protein (DUF305 family)